MNAAVAAALALASLLGTVASPSPSKDKYTTKYDGIDLDMILGNERLYRSYFDCIVAADLARARCTTDGALLRSRIPDALQNDCAKCSEKQKEGVKKVIDFIRNNRQNDWKVLVGKYDPTGIYTKKNIPNS